MLVLHPPPHGKPQIQTPCPGADLGFSRGGGGAVQKTLKRPFGHFLENFDRKKSRFFWRALPLKVSIYWHRMRL